MTVRSTACLGAGILAFAVATNAHAGDATRIQLVAEIPALALSVVDASGDVAGEVDGITTDGLEGPSPGQTTRLHTRATRTLLETQPCQTPNSASQGKKATRQAGGDSPEGVGSRTTQALENDSLRGSYRNSATMAVASKFVRNLGATWFRRGLQSHRSMPRCRSPRKSNCKLLVANNDNYALAA